MAIRQFSSSVAFALLTSACSGDPNCSAFDYAPAPAVIVLRDESGDKLCESSSVVVTNANYTEDADVPEPAERKQGYNQALTAFHYVKECELRIASWYDRDAELPLEVELVVQTEQAVYEGVRIEFDVERDSCGDPVARTQTVRLNATP